MTITRRAPVSQRVLDTADRLFYAEGIHAVGIDRIVAEAGVAKASLYTHFRSKDALVSAYLGGRSRAWQDHVRTELAARGGDPVDQLLAVFDLLGEWFDSPGYRGCPFINAAAECGGDPTVADLTGRHRSWVRSLFTDLLDQAGAAMPADVVVMQLCLLYDGAMVAAQLDPDSDAATAARTAASTVVKGATSAILQECNSDQIPSRSP